MKRYFLPIIAVIAAAGLAGCAGQSQYYVHFFKAYGPGDRYDTKSSTMKVDQRYQDVRIITVTQTDPLSSSSRAKPANHLGTASHRPSEGDGGRNEGAAGQRFSDGGE